MPLSASGVKSLVWRASINVSFAVINQIYDSVLENISVVSMSQNLYSRDVCSTSIGQLVGSDIGKTMKVVCFSTMSNLSYPMCTRVCPKMSFCW